MAQWNEEEERPKISREEAEEIGRKAAVRSLSIKCRTIAEDMDSVRKEAFERLHTLIYNFGVALSEGKSGLSPASKEFGLEEDIKEKKARLLKGMGIAGRAVRETLLDTGYVLPGDVEALFKRLDEIRSMVEEDKLPEALEAVGTLSEEMFDLMLKTVVACECMRV